MSTDQRRIHCPRCGANNFLGQPRCFQCGASLPPPDTMADSAASARQVPLPLVPPAYAHAHTQRGPGAAPWIAAGVALAIVLVVGLGLLALRSRVRPANTVPNSVRTEMEELDRLRTQHPAVPAAAVPSPDAAAQERELNRLREKYHIGESGDAPAPAVNPVPDNQGAGIPNYETH